MDARLKKVVRDTFCLEKNQEIPLSLKAGDIPEWDSFGSIALIAALEEEYQVRFSQEDMMRMDRMTDIERILSKYKGAAT